MDTRAKIVEEERAVEAALRERASGWPIAVVAGCFDPLLAEHARRLGELRKLSGGGPLIAVVCEPAAPLLPARARAELAASLSVVDYVVIDRGCLEGLILRLQPDFVFREGPEDEHRTRQLIAHVQEKVLNTR